MLINLLIVDPNTNEYLLLMQYANGSNLQNYLKNNFNNLTWYDKKTLAIQIANGLNYLHNEEVLHRDLVSFLLYLTILINFKNLL